MADTPTDIVHQLRALARHEHSDLSLGDLSIVVDAATEIIGLRAQVAIETAHELVALAAWLRSPGNIWREDPVDEIARVLENRARALADASALSHTQPKTCGTCLHQVPADRNCRILMMPVYVERDRGGEGMPIPRPGDPRFGCTEWTPRLVLSGDPT